MSHVSREGNVEKAILAEMAKPQSKLIDKVTRCNQIILHNFSKSANRECACQLMGCEQIFDIKLVPNQVLYPKYCEDHRSEFRRQHYLRQFASQPGLYRFESVRVFEIREPSKPVAE